MSLSDLPDDILGLISIQLNGFDNCSLWMASDSKLKQRLINNVITDFDINYTIPGRFIWPGNFLKKLQRLSRLSVVVAADVYHLPIEDAQLSPIETLKSLKLDFKNSHQIFEKKQSISSTNATKDARGPTPPSNNKYINLHEFYPELESFECTRRVSHRDAQLHFPMGVLRCLPKNLKTFCMPSTYLKSDHPKHDLNQYIALLPHSITELNLSALEAMEPLLDCSLLPRNLISLTTNLELDPNTYSSIPQSLTLICLKNRDYDIQELAPFLPSGLKKLNVNSTTLFGDLLARFKHLEYVHTSFMHDGPEIISKYPPNLKSFGGYFETYELKILPFAHGLVELSLEIGNGPDLEFFVDLPQTITILEIQSMYWLSEPFEFFGLLPKKLKSFQSNINVIEKLSLLPESMTNLELMPQTPLQISADDEFPVKLETLALSCYVQKSNLKRLPQNLKSLVLYCSSFIVDDEVIACLPRGLTSLFMETKFSTFIDASKYPENLKTLYLSQYDMTDDSIAKLPRSLRSIHLPETTKLTDKCVKDLPPKLSEIQLPKCLGITSSKDLPPYLFCIEIGGLPRNQWQ